jgi:hypothetical protein
MSLNFFNQACQENPITELEFGLCDDQPGQAAYTNLNNPDSWIATVKHEGKEAVIFTAVDKCVIQDHQYPGRGRCDAMLTNSRCLYLVELKDQDPPWQTHALDQLVSTINFLKDNHDISQFKVRKVFACNKRRDKFIAFDNEDNQRFLKETTFRKDFQTEIIIL